MTSKPIEARIPDKTLRDVAKFMKIEKVSDETLLKSILRVPEMHRADVEVLVLAKQVGGIAIVDDRVARDMARIYRIKHGGTAFSLAFLIVHNLITEEEARIALDDMIRFGWRCSAEKYSKIIRMIEEF